MKKIVLYLVITLVFLAPLYLMYLIDNFHLGERLNGLGIFGDFFGGYIGTIIAIFAAYLVYITYKDQKDKSEKQMIESHFFELLKLHQNNVENLESKDIQIFETYIRLIGIFYKEIQLQRKNGWGDEDILIVSYLFFFYGISNEINHYLEEENTIKNDISELAEHFINKGITYDGCYLDLGIYFRQLFQTVTFINEQKILNYKEKHRYIKILRVRLNIEEQYLLFLNSLIASGLEWEMSKENKNEKLITKYSLLKNIPPNYSQIQGVSYREKYPYILYEDENIDEVKKNERARFEEDYS